MKLYFVFIDFEFKPISALFKYNEIHKSQIYHPVSSKKAYFHVIHNPIDTKYLHHPRNFYMVFSMSVSELSLLRNQCFTFWLQHFIFPIWNFYINKTLQHVLFCAFFLCNLVFSESVVLVHVWECHYLLLYIKPL